MWRLLLFSNLVLGISALSSDIQNAIVNKHNQHRGEVANMPDLTWDDNLASFAQEQAEIMAANGCAMKHTSYNQRLHISGWDNQYVGENLAWGVTTASGPNGVTDQDKKSMAISGVSGWYNEIQDYHYDSNTCDSVCGHYTQMVWEETTKIGCGLAICQNYDYDRDGNNDRAHILSCNYAPGGNISGRKPYGSSGSNSGSNTGSNSGSNSGSSGKKCQADKTVTRDGGKTTTVTITCGTYGSCTDWETKTTKVEQGGGWSMRSSSRCLG